MDDSAQKRRIIIFLSIMGGVVILALAAYFLAQAFTRHIKLPQDFQDARAEAASVSRSVVDISNGTNDDIKSLGALDPQKDQVKGQALVEDAKNKNKDAYDKSVTLAADLNKLASSLSQIPDPNAKQLMYQAVASGISLVTQYIQYTKNLNIFLDAAGALFADPSPENRLRVNSTLGPVNDSVTSINQLNNQFQKSLQDFDAAVK